jgi:hypothetical protein
LVIARIVTAIFSAGIIPMSLACGGRCHRLPQAPRNIGAGWLGNHVGHHLGAVLRGVTHRHLGLALGLCDDGVFFWMVSFLLWRHWKKLDASHHQHHISAGFSNNFFLPAEMLG